MRTGLKVLTAILLTGGIAACGDQTETFEGEEAATPEIGAPATSPAGADQPALTAQFEAPEDAAAGSQVTGTVRIFPENGGIGAGGNGITGRTGATGATDATGDDAGGETGMTGEAGETDLSATTTSAAGGFRVEATLDGLTAGEHAWHIHSGPCGEQAPVEVAFSPTQDMEGIGEALEADDGGHAEGEVTVPSDQLTLDRLQSGEYSIHVHQQGGVNHGPTVACADLSGQTNQTM